MTYPSHTYPQPPKPKKKPSAALIVVLVGLVVLAAICCGVVVIANGGSGKKPDVPAVTTPAGQPSSVQPAAPANTAAAPATTAAAPKVPTIADGTWTVGEDFPAGNYKAVGAGSNCYWSITKSGTNGADIIDNHIGGGNLRVTLKAGQDFETARCGTWTKA